MEAISRGVASAFHEDVADHVAAASAIGEILGVKQYKPSKEAVSSAMGRGIFGVSPKSATANKKRPIDSKSKARRKILGNMLLKDS